MLQQPHIEYTYYLYETEEVPPEGGTIFDLEEYGIQITIPADAVAPGTLIYVYPPDTTPEPLDGADVTGRNQNVSTDAPPQSATFIGLDQTLIEIKMSYEDDDIPPDADESLLRLYRLGDDDKWKLIVGSTVDIDNNIVRGEVEVDNLFSTFGILHGVGYGDCSGDGQISGVDLTEMVLALLEKKVLFGGDTEIQLHACDVTGDGDLEGDDVTQLRLFILGKITEFPVQGAPIFENNFQPPIQTKSLEPIPQKLALLQNYPNPFNPETWIPYTLNQATDVEIQIYNANGQLIRTLRLGEQAAGYYVTRDKSAYWDGTNDVGEQVTSGVYFYKFLAGKQTFVKRMVLLK
jgi:hypothetical protein